MEMTKDKTMDAFLETIADIVDAIPAVEAAGGSPALQLSLIHILADPFGGKISFIGSPPLWKPMRGNRTAKS